MKTLFYQISLFAVILLSISTRLYSATAAQVLTITAERNDFYSVMSIGEHPQAHNAAQQGEDANLLMFDVDMTPSAIYSLSECNTALSVNIMKNIEFIPIAYHVIDGSNVSAFTLSFEGASQFKEKELSVFDSYTGQSVVIEDGLSATFDDPGSDVTRYYVMATQKQSSPKVTTSCETAEVGMIQISTLGNGQMQIASPSDIQALVAYSTSGQMIGSTQEINAQSTEVNLPQGACILSITTSNGISTHKVIVK